MKPNRVLLIGNPTAQSGKNAERIALARSLLDRLGLAHDFRPTLPHGRTVGDVAQHLKTHDYDTAVYMGGDGTFAEVAKAILASGRATEVRLGMLPTGTANDQGKSFGLSSAPDDLGRNVDVIAAGWETLLDAGRVHAIDRDGTEVRADYFFDSAGWGISPRVLALRNEDRRAIEAVPVLREVYRDHLVYAGAMLRTFLASYVEDDKFDVDIVADGKRLSWTRLSDLVVKGTRVYGGLWVLDPHARHDDGRFEAVPFMGKRDWVSKAMVHLDETGTFNDALQDMGVEHSHHVSASMLELTFHSSHGALPLAAQIDGEEFPATNRVRIDVIARALRLIVPEDALAKTASVCASCAWRRAPAPPHLPGLTLLPMPTTITALMRHLAYAWIVPASTAFLGCLSSASARSAPSPQPPADAAIEAPLDTPGDAAPEAPAGIEASVYAYTDLPRTSATQGLSATAFDPSTRTLYALQDFAPSIVPLAIDDSYHATPGSPISLTGRPHAEWDGEGLALAGQQLIAVTVETQPLVERFSVAGEFAGAAAIPSVYANQRGGNKGNESLAVSPDGQFLFTANEQALLSDGDGPTSSSGSTVRIARIDIATSKSQQFAWRTEPLGPGTGGDMGVSEVACLDADTLLVLERGYQSDYGNTARLFRTSLSGGTDISAVASLGADAPLLPKQLVVDFVSLPSEGFTHPGTQPNPILDNYEALSVGPTLPDGRRLLFVTSDDNQQSSQVARVLVLAIRGL